MASPTAQQIPVLSGPAPRFELQEECVEVDSVSGDGTRGRGAVVRLLVQLREMGKALVNGVNGHNHRPLSPYESMVRALSDRLVEAQRPIRILDAIKWDDDVERAFFEKGCRELPPVG